MAESPTLFDTTSCGQLQKEDVSEMAFSSSTGSILHRVENQHPQPMVFDVFSQPLDNEAITPLYTAESATDIPAFSKPVTLKVNLEKFTQETEYGCCFEMQKFMRYATITAHLADDLFELTSQNLTKTIALLEKNPAKHNREIAFLENIREQRIGERKVTIDFRHEKTMLARIGLAAPYDSAFISEIKKVFIFKLFQESVALAKIRGAFPSFSATTDVKQSLTSEIRSISQPLFEEMMQFGRRNTFIC